MHKNHSAADSHIRIHSIVAFSTFTHFVVITLSYHIHVKHQIQSGVNLVVRIAAMVGASLYKSSLVAIAALWTLGFLIYGIIVNTDHIGVLILGVIWNAFIIYVSVSFSFPHVLQTACFSS